MNAIEQAKAAGYGKVGTAAGLVEFDRWTVDTDNLEFEKIDGDAALVGPWRDLSTFEEIIRENNPEQFGHCELARDRWPLYK